MAQLQNATPTLVFTRESRQAEVTDWNDEVSTCNCIYSF